MSAAEDDTELRDLLLQNLENSGVLSRLKVGNAGAKPGLNRSRVVASLVLDFLQVFDLDFSRSVFEPEISALESRDLLCKDLDLNPNPKSPLLLELVQRHHQHRTKDRTKDWTKDQKRRKGWINAKLERGHFLLVFHMPALQDGAGSINKDDAKRVFFDLFPKMNRWHHLYFFPSSLLSLSFLSLLAFPPLTLSLLSLSFSFLALSPLALILSSCSFSSRSLSLFLLFLLSLTKGVSGLDPGLTRDPGLDSGLNPDPQRDLDLDHVDDGDSFFDDPLPAPQKTYGCELSIGEEIEEVSIEGPEPSDKVKKKKIYV
uniref:FGFR1 oncogene partner (FOP) N-terminal dimerisation domain-containing protein n=1 Tax=Periophthalmus magnuspinnatus TaxID=409849 RepID=A0A3B3ZDE2_9GOBI